MLLVRSAVAGLFMIAACQRAPVGAADLAMARAAAVELFEALDASDCSRLGRVLLEPLPAHRCAEAMREHRQHQTRMGDISSAVVDGRNESLILVRVRGVSKGRDREWLVRAVRDGPTWRVGLPR